MPTLIFVYGTLQQGFDNEWAHRLWSVATNLGEAAIAGRLHRLDSFAALVPDAASIAYGQVARLPDETMLKELDAYEGDDYCRTLCDVMMDDGTRAQAWVYLYAGTRGELPRFDGVRWPLK